MTDVDEFELAPARPRTSPATRRRNRQSGPWRWAALAAALVLAGAATTPDHPLPLGAGAEQGPTSQLLDVDLSTPPTVAWSSDIPTPHNATAHLQIVGDVVVVAADVIVIPRSCSSGIQSIVAAPSWVSPRR